MKNITRWAALAGVLLSSCGPSPITLSQMPQGTVEPPAGSFVDASFAAMSSSSILNAAMAYPALKVAEAPAPPVSLTASDGTGLRLVSLEGGTVIDGPLAFTELRLRFENPADRVIEGRFAITLPPGAAISRLAMRLDTGWQEAEVVERQLARQAYEDFLHRRQDPALLEKEAGNEFRARIFPIPARGTKDIILSYSQEMAQSDAAYRLPLRGLPVIDHLRLTALVARPGAAGATVQYEKKLLEHKSYKPDHDFEVALPRQTAGLRHDDVVLARIRPEISADLVKLDGVLVLFDTSASRALGFAAEVARLGRMVEQIRKSHGDAARITLATFDHAVTLIFQGPVRELTQKHLDAVLARRPLGASNLHAALTWPGRPADHRRVVVFSDGIATAGPVEGDALRAAVQGLKGSVDRLDVVLVGGIRDEELMTRLVRGTLERDGTVLDGTLPEGEIVRRLGQATQSGIVVKVAGSEWVWPDKLDGRQPGDEVLVYAGLKKGALAPGKPLAITLSTGQKVEVALTPVAGPLLQRSAVSASISRLGFLRDQLAAEQHEEREKIRQQIIAISTRHRVLSDFTALLVLESERDYQRFGIDRRALADILAVDESGVKVLARANPVLAVAAPPPPKQPVFKPKAKPEPPRRPTSVATPSKPATEPESAPRDSRPSPPREMPKNGESGEAAHAATASPMADRGPPSGAKKDEEDIGGKEMKAPEATASGGERPRPGAGGAASAFSPQGRSQGMAPPRAMSPPPAPPPPPPPPSPEPAMERVRPGPVRMDNNAAPPSALQDVPMGPSPYTGRMATVMDMIAARKTETAVVEALRWRSEDATDVMALIALGEALEAHGNRALAARAYGSIIDLFPARADLRRFAAERLERLGAEGADLAADSYAKGVEQRPDHLNGHRLLGYALLRQGKPEAAFAALEAGLRRDYPGGRFLGGERVLREDMGLIGAAWVRQDPGKRSSVESRLAARGARLPTGPSLRFVLHWETDANDVDFHILDSRGGHAFYSNKILPSGGELYEDITTGYGPECFTIEGKPGAYPYRVRLHYYSRGPMGYGMGKLDVIQHDGNGNLRFEQRPFVVMNDGAYVNLGEVSGPLGMQPITAPAQVAR
jgi:hypothetical protein